MRVGGQEGPCIHHAMIGMSFTHALMSFLPCSGTAREKFHKALQPQVVAGALACIDLVCSAGYEDRYAFSDGVEGRKRNTDLYT